MDNDGTTFTGSAPAPNSIDFAASRILEGPAPAATPKEDPEGTAEPVQDDYEPVDNPETEGSNSLDEEEGTAEEAEGEEPEETEEGQEPTYYTIKVDGEELEVSLDELQSGYQRQKDYTKKTQAVAEQRKFYEQKSAEIQELHQSYIHQATLANELLNRDLEKYKTVDWAELRDNDPIGYLQKQIEIQELKDKQADLQQQAQSAYEHNQTIQKQESQQQLEFQRKEALRIFPDWKDETKAATHMRKLVEYGYTLGYTDQELSNVINAKDLVLLDKARKYDETIGVTKSIKDKATAPAIRKVHKSQGLAPKGSQQQKLVEDRRVTLRKSGSLKDAAALMYEMQNSQVIRKNRR